MKIKDIPVNERPREKLLEYGSSNLSNDELLAIILRQGTKNRSAREIGAYLLNQVKNIADIKDMTFKQLTNIKGIGSAQALTLLATIELGRRIFMNKSDKRIKITNSSTIDQ